MSIREQLEKALLEAIKSNNVEQKNAIRMVLTHVKISEAEKGDKLDDAGIMSLIQKEIKQHHETIEGAKKANRTDLIETAQKEIEELEKFLPKQMTSEELMPIVKQAIADSQAVDMKDMGKVMKEVLSKVAGKAPNDVVSKIVRDLLSQPK